MGDILVFLTGQDDIDAAVQLLTEETQNRRKNSSGAVDVEALPIVKNFGCVGVWCVLWFYHWGDSRIHSEYLSPSWRIFFLLYFGQSNPFFVTREAKGVGFSNFGLGCGGSCSLPLELESRTMQIIIIVIVIASRVAKNQSCCLKRSNY